MGSCPPEAPVDPSRAPSMAGQAGRDAVSWSDLVEMIRRPSVECRPELRWWLAQGLHTDETLRHEVDVAHRRNVIRRHGRSGAAMEVPTGHLGLRGRVESRIVV